MKAPWLNVDAGELEHEPAELYALAHGVNVACGGHAGDAAAMRRVLDACKIHGTRVGAHPSYPDRASFGRARMAIADDALAASLSEQCALLARMADRAEVVVTHAKLHGALYHAANEEPSLARLSLVAIVSALGKGVVVLGPARGAMREAAENMGLSYAREGFADRGVRADGSLVPRGEPGALVFDPLVARANALRLAGQVDTICVHGDTEGAAGIARAVREALDGLAASSR